MLEQHAHAAGRTLAAHFTGRATQHRDAATRRVQQAQHLAQQHRLAGARAPHQRQHLAAVHREIKVLVHSKGLAALAKDGPQPFDADHGFGGSG